MKLGIVGSQERTQEDAVRRYVAGLPQDTIVLVAADRSVLGGGYQTMEVLPGVERIAWDEALKCGLAVAAVGGSREKHGVGHRRQAQDALVRLSDALVAFWDEEERRVAELVANAWQQGKQALVIGKEGRALAQPQVYVQGALQSSSKQPRGL